MNPHYPAVAARAGHACEYCRAPEAVFNLPFEVEHVRPLCSGGGDDPSDLALACRSCNLFKGSEVFAVDPLTASSQRLYDPRSDSWTDHFAVELEAGSAMGLTAIGRATVELLRTNSEAQMAARLEWMRLALYP